MDGAMSIGLKLLSCAKWLAGATLAAIVMQPLLASAQVVVVANGSPITAYDIEQRTKLVAASTHKTPTRQEVINELIDDRIKIAKAKAFGFEVPESDVNQAFEQTARNQRLTPAQFTQFLERSGISPITFKARLRAEITWNQLVRGRYSSTLEVGESDVNLALRERNEGQGDAVGYIYTLYPVIVLVPQGAGGAVIESKRREAESLRSRFGSCNQGLAFARGSRDIAVREPVSRSSADLAQQLRDLLGGMQIGQLTTPEVTAQGLQMFALCDKRESKIDTPAKREVRQQLFMKKFEAESKRFLEEVRKSAMIEYK
jgi:peptidyl-prolyl cis-trans isomerase SurA